MCSSVRISSRADATQPSKPHASAQLSRSPARAHPPERVVDVVVVVVVLVVVVVVLVVVVVVLVVVVVVVVLVVVGSAIGHAVDEASADVQQQRSLLVPLAMLVSQEGVPPVTKHAFESSLT
jgi:Flp pilus assembly protein TadB